MEIWCRVGEQQMTLLTSSLAQKRLTVSSCVSQTMDHAAWRHDHKPRPSPPWLKHTDFLKVFIAKTEI